MKEVPNKLLTSNTKKKKKKVNIYRLLNQKKKMIGTKNLWKLVDGVWIRYLN